MDKQRGPRLSSANVTTTANSTSGCTNTELTAIIVSELREAYGIKYRKEKKQHKANQDKHCRKIFNVPLDKLEMTDVILANGGITQVPLFLSDACQRILEHVSTEGLFRKAGSSARQREIRAHLESGVRLGKSHHPIDVANVLKLFIRELPEPLLSTGNLQESILRCLLCGEQKVNALLLSVLLLPTHSLNTLTFFMQFLLTLSEHSAQNRMTTENLAIIFTPGLMPLPDIILPQRLSSHCKVVQMLIEHANHIGIVPRYILERSRFTADRGATVILSQPSVLATPGHQSSSDHHPETDKKKKKRRSGMFNGLRKIVGSALGSNDELDRDSVEMNPSTPCIKESGKKRKGLEAAGLSAKKKRDVMALLPEDKALLPATPMCIKNLTKKTRISLGGKRFEKKHQQPAPQSLSSVIEPIEPVPVLERRWSVVGPGWNRKKPSTSNTENAFSDRSTRKSMSAATDRTVATSPSTSPLINFPHGTSASSVSTATFIIDTNATIRPNSQSVQDDPDDSADFVRIPKSEYEDIKDRVSAIENRISKEFQSVHVEQENAKRKSDAANETGDSILVNGSSALDQVVDKYERTLSMQTKVLDSPTTEHLAKRLSRELKIRRRSTEHPVMRSPSARKIGTMRRRSRENVRVSRNISWHVATTRAIEMEMKCSPSTNTDTAEHSAILHPIVKASLKRGRPNTIQTGLRHRTPPNKPLPNHSIDDLQNEQWTSGEEFFANSETPVQAIDTDIGDTAIQKENPDIENNLSFNMLLTPRFVTTPSLNIKTPMLPPKRPPNFRTPLTVNLNHTRTPMLPPRSNQKQAAPINKALLLTPAQDLQTGRASIARLRSQNAGMVAAKARLFNSISTEAPPTSIQPIALPRESTAFALERFITQEKAKQNNAKHDNKTKSDKEILNKPKPDKTKTEKANTNHCDHARPSLNVRMMKNTPRKSMTPRRGTKNLNGIHRRQKLRLAKSPIKTASPMRLRHLLLNDVDSMKQVSNSDLSDLSESSNSNNRWANQPSNALYKNGFLAAMDSIVNGSPVETQRSHLPEVPKTRKAGSSVGSNSSPLRLSKQAKTPYRATPTKLRHSLRNMKLFHLTNGDCIG